MDRTTVDNMPSATSHSEAIRRWTQRAVEAEMRAEQLRAENDTLRKLNSGHCDRIAAQSELLSNAAAGDAAHQLTLWREAVFGRVYRIHHGDTGRLLVVLRENVAGLVIVASEDEALLTPVERAAFADGVVCCGYGASLGKCIMVALGEWERKYGKDGG